MSHDHLGLFDTPPDRRQIRFSLAIVGLLIAAFLLILPARDVRLREFNAIIPLIDAVLCLSDLITATLLYAQASVFRSRALSVLGAGYVYMALLLIPHALTFPGAFAPSGSLGAGVDTTAWIAFLRRAAFPIAVMLYVRLRRPDSTTLAQTERPGAAILVGVLAAVVLAAAATTWTTAGQRWLPPFFVNRAELLYTRALGYEAVEFSLFAVAAVALFRKRSSVLDMWLLVAFAADLIQSLLIIPLHGRFTVGWYGLYGLMLFAHLVVTLALVAESNRLYSRLALATSLRSREREVRLMSLDALAAAISHEVGQPLTAVGAHARAGLNRLKRPQADVPGAIESLEAIIVAGHSASDVIKSMRPTVVVQPGAIAELDLNDLVRATASLLERELIGERVTLRLTLDKTLPPILADRVKLQRVLVNLLTNAIESVSATRGRPRRILVNTWAPDDQDVLLEITDNGVGIAPEHLERMFETFFTTKATGAGLGLSLCRTIAEAHGGRLWASPGQGHGATFHLQLPRSGLWA